MPDILEELRGVLGGSQLLTGSAVHADYTHDEAMTAAPVAPLAVVFPGSTDDVAKVLRLAHHHRVPVVARGSGTGLSGGCLPVADGIVLAFDRMRAIREIDTENQVVVIEPGVTLDELNRELRSAAMPPPTPGGCAPCGTA